MKDSKKNFLVKKKYLNFIKKQEVLGEPFYDKLGQLYKFYLPICEKIFKENYRLKKTMVLGLAGGQGSGKSTIAEILKLILNIKYDLKTISFSIDDFYKTLNERKEMSNNVHKLFLTRGVPGTHSTKLLKSIFKKLLSKKFKTILIPKFDKSVDDRMPKNKWTKIRKKPDVIIFEGWCVGSKPQLSGKLKKPINSLERLHDKNRLWRKTVNSELKNNYKRIFSFIDMLIFLKVPNFKYVFKWRLLQEKKLKLLSKGKKIMSKEQVKSFIMYYERITRQMLTDLKIDSDIVINLDKKHRLNSIKF